MAIWTKSLTAFEANNAAIHSLCQFGSKIYAGTYYTGVGSNNYAQIWESTDGITWTKNATFPASSGDGITGPSTTGLDGDKITGMVVLAGILYVLRVWAGQPRIYSTADGITWVVVRKLYTAYGLTYSKNLMTDGSKLYVSGSYSATILYSAATPSGTWASELTATNLFSGTKSIAYGSDIFLVGDKASTDTYIYRKTGGSWNSGTVCPDSNTIYDGCIFKNKLYFIGDSQASPGTKTNLYCWDGASWTTTLLLSTPTTGGTIFVSADNYLYTNAADTSPGGITTYNFYRSADGSTFSTTEAIGNAATGLWLIPRSHSDFDRRTLLGSAGSGSATGAIYYSGQLTGACVGNSSWNESDLTFALSNGPC